MSDFLYNFIDGSSVTGESTFDIYRSTVNPDATYEDFLAFMQSGPQGPQGEPGPKGDKGEPASENLSELNNDAGFITNLVNDLQNYYLKSESYNKDEVNELVSQIPKFNIEVVESLPSEEVSTTTVYLLKADEEGNNLYTEYIYVNDKWEILGSQKIDLSNYYDKPQIDELIGDIKDNLKDIAIPLLLDNWELDGTVYKQTVTVNGLTEDSNPIIVISPVGEKATEVELDAFNCLTNDIIVSNGSITFNAKKLPSMSFTVVAKGITANGDTVATVTELVAKVSKMESELADKIDNTDSRLSDARTPLEHNHDDAYYTEIEIDGKFNVVNQNISDNTDAISQLNSDLLEINEIQIIDFAINCPFVHEIFACCEKNGTINYSFTLKGLLNGWNTICSIPHVYAPYNSSIEFPIHDTAGSYAGFGRIAHQNDGSHLFTIYNTTNSNDISGYVSYIKSYVEQE